jgi:hypothetical protein
VGLEWRQTAFFQQDETLEVVTGSLQLQDEGRAHNAKAAHQFPTHRGQGAKHMLDTGSWRGDRAVAPFLRLGNVYGCMASSLDVHTPTGLLRPCSPYNAGVATVGIHITAGVARVEQLFKDAGVGYGGMRDSDSTNELAALVDAGVQLVAEVILAMLPAPLGVYILLRSLVFTAPAVCRFCPPLVVSTHPTLRARPCRHS